MTTYFRWALTHRPNDVSDSRTMLGEVVVEMKRNAIKPD